jgi:hypothetical protein
MVRQPQQRFQPLHPRRWSAAGVLDVLRDRWCSLPPTVRPAAGNLIDLICLYEVRALQLAGRWPLTPADLHAVTRPCSCTQPAPHVVIAEGPRHGTA